MGRTLRPRQEVVKATDGSPRVAGQGIVQHYHDPLLAGDHDIQELAKAYQRITRARKRLAYSLPEAYP